MSQQIKVPAVGESVTEATIAEWVKQDGDFVERDDILLVLETDKASVEVVAESAGQLKTTAQEGDTVSVGTAVGEIDTSKSGPTPQASSTTSAQTSPAPTPQPSTTSPAAHTPKGLSPAVRKIVAERQLDSSQIPATGPRGNITKADALSFQPGQAATSSASSSAGTATATPSASSTGGVRREKMSRIRQTIAKRLVQSQQDAAILTTFNEIDMSQVIALRKTYKESFAKKHGVNLGFMGFFVKAAVEALKAFPRVNAYIEGDEMVFHDYNHIGIAVGTEKGLMVPVLKNAEHMSLAQVEQGIKDYALKARDGKISMDDLSGGTFTISNGGVYGSLMSTPILNPPQSGILGLHKIEERPMAIDGQVVIRPMMYVALSYDHRIIDGSESVKFLVRIKECIEDPTRILMEI